MLAHFTSSVNSDELKEFGFSGDLADFAAKKANERMKERFVGSRIVTVESSYYTEEVRPVMCNSGTWYKRRHLTLSVWLDVGETVHNIE